MDAFRLAGIVIVEQQLRLLVRIGFAILVIAVLVPPAGADDLLRRDAINPLGIDTHEVLAAAGDNEGLVAVGAQIAQDFQHRLIGQLGIGLVPAGCLAVAIQSSRRR